MGRGIFHNIRNHLRFAYPGIGRDALVVWIEKACLLHSGHLINPLFFSPLFGPLMQNHDGDELSENSYLK